MLLHNPFGDGEANAGSAKLTASCLIYTVKALEDLALILLRNPDSRIAHSEDGHFASDLQE